MKRVLGRVFLELILELAIWYLTMIAIFVYSASLSDEPSWAAAPADFWSDIYNAGYVLFSWFAGWALFFSYRAMHGQILIAFLGKCWLFSVGADRPVWNSLVNLVSMLLAICAAESWTFGDDKYIHRLPIYLWLLVTVLLIPWLVHPSLNLYYRMLKRDAQRG